MKTHGRQTTRNRQVAIGRDNEQDADMPVSAAQGLNLEYFEKLSFSAVWECSEQHGQAKQSPCRSLRQTTAFTPLGPSEVSIKERI